MFVIIVVPLKRGVALDQLTYFSTTSYASGTIVTIRIRNAEALGLVTDAKPVSKAKAALRAATFSLKKLPEQKEVKRLGEAFIKTAEELGSEYSAHLGTILYTLLAPEIRNGLVTIPHTHHPEHIGELAPQVLQASKKERYITYRSLVRETFAHSGSVLLVVPTSIEAELIRTELEQGIADRIVFFSSSAKKSEIQKAFMSLEDFSKTKLIIATPSYALVERHDITLTIVEHERSPFYRTMNRPYLDYRSVLRIHAKHTGRQLLYGDMLLRSEEEYARRKELFLTRDETPKRLELSGTLKIISVGQETDTAESFTLFAPETVEAIKQVRKKRGRVFLYAARRGLAPVVACMDCGHIFRSITSGAPYSLIRTMEDGVEKRWFVCGVSGEKKPAPDLCTECSSWRLRERGIGIQHVYDELHKIFPDVPVVMFDHISAKTYAKALFLRDTFYSSRKGIIMLGTAMAIPYLNNPVDLSVVVNMDALLATPTWRIEEENLALLLSLREQTLGDVIVQTRAPQTDVLTHAKNATVENFYTEELALREKLNYPPYVIFVHLTWQGTPEVVKMIEAQLTTILEPFKPLFYQHPTSPAMKPIMYCLMRIQKEHWPDPKLMSVLKTIPPSVRLMINPDKII